MCPVQYKASHIAFGVVAREARLATPLFGGAQTSHCGVTTLVDSMYVTTERYTALRSTLVVPVIPSPARASSCDAPTYPTQYLPRYVCTPTSAARPPAAATA